MASAMSDVAAAVTGVGSILGNTAATLAALAAAGALTGPMMNITLPGFARPGLPMTLNDPAVPGRSHKLVVPAGCYGYVTTLLLLRLLLLLRPLSCCCCCTNPRYHYHYHGHRH